MHKCRLHHKHRKHFEIIHVYLDGQNVLSLKENIMANITIDVESNKADLDALVSQLDTALANVATITSQITSFQLTFTVTEVPNAVLTENPTA